MKRINTDGLDGATGLCLRNSRAKQGETGAARTSLNDGSTEPVLHKLKNTDITCQTIFKYGLTAARKSMVQTYLWFHGPSLSVQPVNRSRIELTSVVGQGAAVQT